MAFEFLKNTNAKLGPGIWTFSLPAILTCPGRGVCESFCYAARLERYRPNVGERLQQVLARTEQPGWEREVIREAIVKDVRTIRLHAHGDFHTAGYIRSWTTIVRALPDVRFFGYTRSWKVARLRKSLDELRTEPNVSIYASVESQEWDSPMIKGWKRALVIEGFEKSPGIGSLICPEQTWRKLTGTTMAAKDATSVNCSTCRHCIKGKDDILFVRH